MYRDIKEQLFIGEPLNYYDIGLGYVYQPTLRELVRGNCDELTISEPFLLLEKQFRSLKDNKDIKNISLMNVFGLLLLLEQESEFAFAKSIKKSLQMLYKVEDKDIEFLEENGVAVIHIQKKYVVVDDSNIRTLMDIIFQMFMIDLESVFKDENDDYIIQTGSKRELELIEIFKKKDRRNREKHRLYIRDRINIIAVMQNRNYDEIYSWPYYRLACNYRATINYKKDAQDFRIMCSGRAKEISKFDWIQESKI